MFSVDDIKKYVINYKILNGQVIDKRNNQIVTDEDITLRVKASILLYTEARNNYQEDINQFGQTNKSQDDYISKTMEKYSVNGEINSFGINKVVNSIVKSAGHYEEYISGDNLSLSKFSFLVPPKNEYGLAYLRLKFQEQGLDIEDLKIFLDTSELKHNGVSKVIINFKIKKYEKRLVQGRDVRKYRHPKASELNELESQKKIAKQKNDIDLYNSLQRKIEKLVRDNPTTELSPAEWDTLSRDEKIEYIKLKINEAKVLKDDDSVNYWTANLKNLEQAQNLGNHDNHHFSNTLGQKQSVRDEKSDYKYYLGEMLNAVSKFDLGITYSEKEMKQIIGEVFYNEMYLIERVRNENDISNVLTTIANTLVGSKFKERLFSIILIELQEKYSKLYPSKKKDVSDVKVNDSKTIKEEQDFSVLIGELRNKLNKIQNSYKQMLSDGVIDDNEFALLKNMINNVIDDGYSLKSVVIKDSDKKRIAIIIDELEEEKHKIDKTERGLANIDNSFRI